MATTTCPDTPTPSIPPTTKPILNPIKQEDVSEYIPHNKYVSMINAPKFTVLPSFTLESGTTLYHVPVCYKTWGKLNDARDNVMVIWHALSGSADVEDWWGPLLGPSKPFDPTKYFIYCGNVFGSPYGTASPITINPITHEPYGPQFPVTTIRDDVSLHHRILTTLLGVTGILFTIGGSMGGMHVLEHALLYTHDTSVPKDFIKNVVPIATSAKHSAWCISWLETQRQSIYTDPFYCDGYYYLNTNLKNEEDENRQPVLGLGVARMNALLTYRTRNSFEKRFGRRIMYTGSNSTLITKNQFEKLDENAHGGNDKAIYSAQSYLRYQATKFVNRFDANCYIAITKKLDTHDISRGTGLSYTDILQKIDQKALVIGIATDGLFTLEDQYDIHDNIRHSTLVIIESGEGHDGFLLELGQMKRVLGKFIRENGIGGEVGEDGIGEMDGDGVVEGGRVSMVGEDDDLLQW